jgi:hypothetical protein
MEKHIMAKSTLPDPAHQIGAHMARAAAMISAIQAISGHLEDACGNAVEGFDLTTAIEACAQVAATELQEADLLWSLASGAPQKRGEIQLAA